MQESEESMEIKVEAPSPPIIEHFDYGEEESSQSPAAPIAPVPPVMESKPVAAAPATAKAAKGTGRRKAPMITFTETENKEYELPPIKLLTMPKKSNQAKEHKNIYKNAEKLEKTFQSFGVKAKVAKVHHGPAVTKYEVYPDVGVKVSKIVNLSDDLALALAAKDIRIEAPIPGNQR